MYRFRRGCFVHSYGGSHYIIDNLRQIKIPINQSAAELLADIPQQAREEEKAFLAQLYSLSFLITEDEFRVSRRFANSFREPLICEHHKSIF